MFSDRTDAGRRLAEVLLDRGVDADVVLAIPRGGLPVGRVVADRLGLPLDVVAARKIGAPGNPELAVGAVASDGTTWLNESLLADLSVEEAYVEGQTERERQAAAEKVARYRADRPPLDVAGKRVLVVDDGAATGATTIACVRQVGDAGAASVILALPVAPPETVVRLRDEADEVVCVETSSPFGAVGQYYDTFEQVPDERAMAYLRGDE